jgi:hypothetical protein
MEDELSRGHRPEEHHYCELPEFSLYLTKACSPWLVHQENEATKTKCVAPMPASKLEPWCKTCFAQPYRHSKVQSSSSTPW